MPRADFSWESFWAMGGYANFVWPCYILAILTLIGVFYFVRRSDALAKKQLKQLEKHEA